MNNIFTPTNAGIVAIIGVVLILIIHLIQESIWKKKEVIGK